MKKITLLCGVIAAMGLATTAVAKNQSPTDYTLNDNDTTQIVLSSVDMNRIMIVGDTISAIHCPTGFCVTGKTDGNGGALLSLANGEPFTLFLDTTKGRHVGVLVLPASTTGKTIALKVNATENETVDNIEHQQGYDAKYVYILRHVLHAYWNNTPLQGYDRHRYTPKEQTQHTVNYGALQSTPLAQYDSPHYIATVYLLTNKSPSTLPLTPAMFHKKGMPALSLAADSLNSGKISTLVTLRSK